MRFLRPCRGNLEFGREAVDQLMRHRQLVPKAREAGGVLLGRLLLDSQDVIVDEATIPTRYDRRGLFSFFRKRAPTQKRVTEAWRETSQTRNYLGEWHTHPEDQPAPSNDDKANWKRVLREAKFEQESLFFVIVGRLSIGVWEASKSDCNPVALERLEEASRG